ncbi:MAG: STAS domain-containing protein [Phycisphaerales bacterium]
MAESSFTRVEPLPLDVVRPGSRASIAVVTVDKVGGREAPIVQQELTAAAEASRWRLGIDLSGVTLLSSIGLGALVTLHKRAREEGGAVVIFGIGKELMDVLKLTHLDRVLSIVKDSSAATKAIA